MKKTFAVINSLLLVFFISMSADAQKDKTKELSSKTKKSTEKVAEKTADTSKKAGEKTADTAKSAGKKAKDVVAPKSDDDIQRCVTDKLTASASLKGLGLNAATADGVVTLTGTAKTSKDKKAAAKIGKDCGAKTVTNNIEAPPEKAVKSEPKEAKSESKEAKSQTKEDKSQSKDEKKSAKKSESSKKN